MRGLVNLVSILILTASAVLFPPGGQLLEVLSHVGHHHSPTGQSLHTHGSEQHHRSHHHRASEEKHHHAEAQVEVKGGSLRVVHAHAKEGESESSEPHEHRVRLSLSSQAYVVANCDFPVFIQPEPQPVLLEADVLFSSHYLDRLFRPPKA